MSNLEPPVEAPPVSRTGAPSLPVAPPPATAAQQASPSFAAAPSGAPANPLGAPWRQTPRRFRRWLIANVVAVVVAFVALGIWAPGPPTWQIATEPALLVLLALVLLAETYLTLPWMRGSNPLDEYILSTPLLLAALLVFGPHAAPLFLIAGVAMTVALRMVWWRVLLNVALWGLQGAAAAGVLVLITGHHDWAEPLPAWTLLPISAVLFVVIEALNTLLIGVSLTLLGARTWHAHLSEWRGQLAVGWLALAAPVPAVLAEGAPILLPLLAVAMVAAQYGVRAVSSVTVLAGRDALTNVANRATLYAALEQRLSRRATSRDRVRLLLVDLDEFKPVNDVHGHLVGDRVLIEVARRLEESVRTDDLVARVGGDEFAILLAPGAVAATAAQEPLAPAQRSIGSLADRIRTAIRRPISVDGLVLVCGASVGTACSGSNPVTPGALVAQADADLYRMKAARHRDEVAGQPPAADPSDARPAARSPLAAQSDAQLTTQPVLSLAAARVIG